MFNGSIFNDFFCQRYDYVNHSLLKYNFEKQHTHPADCIWLHNHWKEQWLATQLCPPGEFEWGSVPLSRHPSNKHCFNRNGRVWGLEKTSWYVTNLSADANWVDKYYELSASIAFVTLQLIWWIARIVPQQIHDHAMKSWKTSIISTSFQIKNDISNGQNHNIKHWMFPTFYGPLAIYVKLRVAHALAMPETFSPPRWVGDPDMHHGTYVPRCTPGSLTNVSFEVDGGENVPGILGARATCNFAYLARGQWSVFWQ